MPLTAGDADAQAEQRRGTTLALALRESDTGSQRWLRKLHGSRVPGDRAFSTCVHREDVETVSYTELTCTDRRVECEYVVGSPCAVGASAIAAVTELEAVLLIDSGPTSYLALTANSVHTR
jgi:hypothetical protein